MPPPLGRRVLSATVLYSGGPLNGRRLSLDPTNFSGVDLARGNLPADRLWNYQHDGDKTLAGAILLCLVPEDEAAWQELSEEEQERIRAACGNASR
jgi:hypothetical protein